MIVNFPLYFTMDSRYTNEVSVYKLYLLQPPIERCPGRTSQSLTRQLPLKGEPLAGRAGPCRTSKVCADLKQECPATEIHSSLTRCACPEAAALVSEARSFAPCRAMGVQRRAARHASGSPFGRAGERSETERASPLRQFRCTAIGRLFIRAILSPCLSFSVSVLALSVTCGDTSPKGRGFCSRSG